MKRTILAFGLLIAGSILCTLNVQAQMRFIVVYDEVQTVRGELYQYSQRYLGTTDVIMEDATTYILQSVKQADNREDKNGQSSVKREARPIRQTVVKQQLPLNEDAIMATSASKKAESVAKQIYRIREARMNILAGETEHAPADGRAMDLALKELDKQEKALTAMFVGSTTTIRHTKEVIYASDESKDAENAVLCRFSKYAGPVASDDLSGEPVHIIVKRYYKQVPVMEQPRRRNEEPLYKEQLTRTDINIEYNGKKLWSDIILAQ